MKRDEVGCLTLTLVEVGCTRSDRYLRLLITVGIYFMKKDVQVHTATVS